MAAVWKTPDDVLDYAIGAEELAISTFTQMAEDAELRETRSLLLKLSAEEVEHKKQLHAMKDSRVLSKVAVDLTEMERAYRPRTKSVREMTPHEALKFAVQLEKDSQLFYQSLSEMVQDEELAIVFRMLADEEQAHVREFQVVAKE